MSVIAPVDSPRGSTWEIGNHAARTRVRPPFSVGPTAPPHASSSDPYETDSPDQTTRSVRLLSTHLERVYVRTDFVAPTSPYARTCSRTWRRTGPRGAIVALSLLLPHSEGVFLSNTPLSTYGDTLRPGHQIHLASTLPARDCLRSANDATMPRPHPLSEHHDDPREP